MAPTVTIETIAIVRPLKVIALVCGVITALLILLALTSSSWLQTDGLRQGLFEECIVISNSNNLDEIEACQTVRSKPYITASAALCVLCFLLDIIGTCLTGFALSTNETTKKSKFYRNAIWTMTLSLIFVLISLILYPVCFAQDLPMRTTSTRGRNIEEIWEFGWAYGVGWGAAIFLFGSIVLLLCDQEEEEIYYKERTIIHGENDSRA